MTDNMTGVQAVIGVIVFVIGCWLIVMVALWPREYHRPQKGRKIVIDVNGVKRCPSCDGEMLDFHGRLFCEHGCGMDASLD